MCKGRLLIIQRYDIPLAKTTARFTALFWRRYFIGQTLMYFTPLLKHNEFFGILLLLRCCPFFIKDFIPGCILLARRPWDILGRRRGQIHAVEIRLDWVIIIHYRTAMRLRQRWAED
jgi:hypothetical protein